MTILTALQDAAGRLTGERPTVFFSSSNKFEVELASLINEVATDLMKTHEWQALAKTHTITGDGTTKEFALPSDYDRMLLAAAVQDKTNWLFGYTPIPDLNTWIRVTTSGFLPVPGGWILTGGKFNFVPAPSNGAMAVFPYISKNYALDNSSTPKDAFTREDDSFVLPERLLTLGLIWRWREMKRLDWTADQENFVKALSEYAASDQGPVIIRTNAAPRGNFGVAWPWELG